MTYEQILNNTDLSPARVLEYEEHGRYAFAKIVNDEGETLWRVRSSSGFSQDFSIGSFDSLLDFVSEILNI